MELEIVDDFYDYESTFGDIEDVAYASLYSAICPPIFKGPFSGKENRLRWYGNYLLELQKEFKELIEFCYDEDFHPEILGHLYPSERLAIYRQAHDLPTFFDRREELSISRNVMGGHEMPFGMTTDELVSYIKNESDSEQRARSICGRNRYAGTNIDDSSPASVFY